MLKAFRASAIVVTGACFVSVQTLFFVAYERFARSPADWLGPLELAEFLAAGCCALWLLTIYVIGFYRRWPRELWIPLVSLPAVAFGALQLAYDRPLELGIACAISFAAAFVLRSTMSWMLGLEL